MSRSVVRRRINFKHFQNSMRDVVSTSVVESTVDEAPDAYKDMHLIIAALGPTVEVTKRLRSVLNVKGTD
jgi:RNA-splicing ligase RtcB